jgi:hypothetical protein
VGNLNLAAAVALANPMNTKRSDDQYDQQESKQRFEAALRGARIAGHKPMVSLTQGKAKKQRKPKKKSKASA